VNIRGGKKRGNLRLLIFFRGGGRRKDNLVLPSGTLRGEEGSRHVGRRKRRDLSILYPIRSKRERKRKKKCPFLYTKSHREGARHRKKEKKDRWYLLPARGKERKGTSFMPSGLSGRREGGGKTFEKKGGRGRGSSSFTPLSRGGKKKKEKKTKGKL